MALSAYKECPRKINKTGDVTHYDDDVFDVLCVSTCRPVHPTPTAPNSFSLFSVHKQYKSPHLPSPPLHHSFLRLSPPHANPSPFRSCTSPHLFLRLTMGPQFGRLQEEIASLLGRRELLQLPPSWTSDDEFALAFHGSIFDPHREAIKLFILKTASCRRSQLRFFPSTVQEFPSHSSPTLSHPSRSFTTHPFVLQNQAHEQKNHRVKVTQHQPSPSSPSNQLPPLSRLSLLHAISSPSSPPSPLPPSPTLMSPHTLSRRPPWSCIAECVRDDQSSAFPLSLYEEDFDVYLPGLDLKTDIVNVVKGLPILRLWYAPLPIDDLSHNTQLICSSCTIDSIWGHRPRDGRT